MIITFAKKIIRYFLNLLDAVKRKCATVTYLEPEKLVTQNRKDIYYRKKFLERVIEDNANYEDTVYFHFISDTSKPSFRKAKSAVNDLVSLLKDVKQDGIIDPVLVTRVEKKKVKVRYTLNGEKHYRKIKNETGYQLVDGAHRVAVALFLGMDQIPAKIYKPCRFGIPDYTKYLEHKIKGYNTDS